MITPRLLSDRYELGEILGFGGMSEVHLARDLKLHRDVAVKLLRADQAVDPSINLRFQREAQNAAALNHPAIAAIYDTGEAQTPSGPLPYIVMEYVDGSTLRDLVRMDGPMPAERAVEVIAHACEALNFSHQRGIIHRDVKPANIMIGPAGSVKVVDFGIAKAIADGEKGVTQPGAVIGTAHYLSPEQARGDRVDARTDVYSLGCVLYEISTGVPPFVGDSSVEVAYQHVRVQPVAPSKRNGAITADLDAVVLKAMAKNPDNRYQTAAEMRADLIRVQRGLAPGGATGRVNDVPPQRNSPTRQIDIEQSHVVGRNGRASVKRWLVVVAAILVLAVAGIIGTNVAGRGPRDMALPDVRGQTSADAAAALHDSGLKTRVQSSADTAVPPGAVIRTVPDVDTAVTAGDEITLFVSSGPAPSIEATQVTMPDVSSLTYAEAVRRLADVGFGRFRQASVPSPPDMKDRVMGTNPPANRTTASTNEITLVMGSGPATAVP